MPKADGAAAVLAMRDHRVEDDGAVRDVDAAAVGVLTEDDRACLDAPGQYLVATDAFGRFAIWLLHRHFEPSAGELFVERVLDRPRRTETAPVGRAVFCARRLSAIAVRFDGAVGSGVGVIGMEFAADFGSVSPLSADDETALAGIAERLHAHGKTNGSACG